MSFNKRRLITLGLGGMALLCSIGWGAFFTTKVAEAEPLKPIKTFRFIYSGTQRYPFQDYYLGQEDDQIKVILNAENPYQREEHIVSKEDMEALQKLAEECKLNEWQGFKGNDPNVLDGYSFYLYITFTDETKLRASGCNSFPKNFRVTQDKLRDFFAKYKTKKEED